MFALQVKSQVYAKFHIDAEVIFSAPLHQVFNLLCIWTHHCLWYVTLLLLHYLTAGVFCWAITHQQSKQGGSVGTQSKPVLRVMEEETAVNSDNLRFVGQEVQDPVLQCGTRSRRGGVLHQGLWNDGLMAEEKSRKSFCPPDGWELCGPLMPVLPVGILLGVHSDIYVTYMLMHMCHQVLDVGHDHWGLGPSLWST